jgi:DNA-binding LytR/AlgR family response regulator
MRVAVVEDEEIGASRLIRLLGRILGDGLASVLRAGSLEEARERLAARPVDLLFLDLNLHGDDGFRLLGEAAAEPFQTIVVSARHDQALRAFEFGVTDFVAKPYDEERLRLAIRRATERDESMRSRLKYLAVRRGPAIIPVPLDAVVAIRGADDYSELICRDGSRHLHGKSLRALLHLLPGHFERVHRSYIVDMRAIESLRAAPGGRHVLRLAAGGEIPVGRARFKDLRNRMG